MTGKGSSIKGLLIVLGLALGCSLSHGETVDGVVIRVNGEIVTRGDLREALKGRGQTSLTPEFLRQFLDQKLLLQEAKRQEIHLPEDALQREVEEMVAEIRGKYPSEKSFRAALAEEGMTLEKLKADLLKRIRTDHQVFQAVGAGGPVKPDEKTQGEAGAGESSSAPTSLRLRRLGVAVTKKGGEQAAAERARQLVQKISVEGLSFEDGVKRYSAVPGAKEDGGDMGWMELSQLSPQVIEATRDLKPGQASPPVPTAGYVSVFYVEGKRGGRAHQLESQFNERKAALLEKLRRKAQVEVYGDSVRKQLPKEYLTCVRNGMSAAPASAAPSSSGGAAAAPSLPPTPTPSPTPRTGLLRLFQKK